MSKISTANDPISPDQGLKNYGARQFEYAFVKRQPASPRGQLSRGQSSRGKSASGFLECACQSAYCVGSISCVGCVTQLRQALRTASSSRQSRTSQLRSPQLRSPQLRTVASELPPVACQLRSCASPNSMLSRMFRNSRRAAAAMKVQRTAERLAHLAKQHQLRSSELLRPASSDPRPCELRQAIVTKRESPLRKFASVASVASQSVSVKSASVKSVSVQSVSVALLRPPKRLLN